MKWISEHKAATAGIAAAAIAGVIFILVWFQPQALFLDTVVDDTLPTAQPTSTSTTTSTQAPGGTVGTTDTTVTETTTTVPVPVVEFPVTLASGQFIDLAHAGTGTALIVELEDGSRVLRFEDLDVDNGPDLRVILSASPLVEDDAAYDDTDFVDLGDLKGNKGNQNYEIPDDVDLDEFATVAIWCRRFNVTFNAAPLDPPATG